MATSGLQRRRVAGASTGADDEDLGSFRAPSTNGTASPASPTESRDPSITNGGLSATHAGTAFEGGSKIAIDRRDLEQDSADMLSSGGRMPRLTLMEEVLLLGLKDKQVTRP